jgi:hypothetical protein
MWHRHETERDKREKHRRNARKHDINVHRFFALSRMSCKLNGDNNKTGIGLKEEREESHKTFIIEIPCALLLLLT